jgi:beta-galactosidase/beta-glucuronidase
MDETRIFNALDSSVEAMAALVRRDRNHPAVAMWSYCNVSTAAVVQLHRSLIETIETGRGL